MNEAAMKKQDTRELLDIWFEFEEWAEGFNEKDENTDVIFQLSDGALYCGTFFTYENLFSQARKNRATGEFLFGKYFCVDKPVFIEKIGKHEIISVINDLIAKGEIDTAFTRIDGKNSVG